MKQFARNLAALSPDGITLPDDLIVMFDWLETQGWHHTKAGGAPQDHYLRIYPPEHQNNPVISHVVFGGTTLPFTAHWSTPDARIDARVFEIGETSTDGGRVALWLDDDGHQRFVHIGHDTAGEITDDPRVLIQFLALGYPEPGHLPRMDITPAQAYLERHGHATRDDFGPEGQPVLPTAFQAFVSETLNVDIPATARDLGITEFPVYGDASTDDRFAGWVNAVTPEPTAQDLEYEEELLRRIETLDLKDDDSSDTIMQKIGTLFQSKDEDPTK